MYRLIALLVLIVLGLTCAPAAQARPRLFQRLFPRTAAPAKAPAEVNEAAEPKAKATLVSPGDITVVGSIGTRDGQTVEYRGIATAKYVDERDLPAAFARSKFGTFGDQYPHIIINGKRLDFDPSSKWYCYAGTKEQPGIVMSVDERTRKPRFNLLSPDIIPATVGTKAPAKKVSDPAPPPLAAP